MATTAYDSTGQNLDSTTQELEQLYKSSQAVRRPFEGQWILNLAYFVGNQWMGFDGLKLYEPQLEDWRAKLVDNRIQPIVRREIAKMTKSRPIWVGVPADQSEEEIAAARMREKVFEHYWPHLKMSRKLRNVLRWARICSAGFWKVTWDDTVGKSTKVLVGPDGKPIKDQYGGPLRPDADFNQLPPEILSQLGQAKPKTVAMGDVCLELRTAFEMLADPLADEEGLDTAEWLIDDAVYSRSYVQRRFDVDLEPDAVAQAGIAESRMGMAVGVTGDEQYKGIRLREFWALSSSEFGVTGKRCVWSPTYGVLEEKGNDYPWLPYVMFGGIPVPGRFWPTSVTEQLISPQTQRNKTLSQLAENAERIGNPPLRVPSTYDGDTPEGLPGEMLEYDPTGGPDSMPSFMQAPELPGYVQSLLGLTDEAMAEISSQHEVSGAQVPAGVTAASAINLLQEADDTVLGPEIAEMEDSITEAGRRVLWLLRNFASDERIARIAGRDGMWDMVAWRGEDLGDGDNDAVQAGSGIPQSKAAKQAAIQEVLNMLVQSGVPLSERALRRVMQEYQVGGLEQFFADQGVDERQVQRENQRLLLGDELPINEYDDDAAHIAGHQECQKSASYDDVPEVHETFQAHVDAHKQRQKERAQEAAQAAAAANAPGTSPTGPPPGVLPSQPSTST